MPTLPFSLSPHICILSSPDLAQLLESSSLPTLPGILQSFSPLPQVVTRTTSLSSVTHPSFALRFSDLYDIENALKEDEERRAARSLDWISARIRHRATRWVDDLEKLGEQAHSRAPWWDELRKCIHGDLVPIRSETWNHPVAVIFAVSTASPNPLQAITALQSQPLRFPPWVDPHILRVNLIVHPGNSSLSDEEVGALFNAVKKQFGIESFLLKLDFPSPPPPPIQVPAPMPKLPPPPPDDDDDDSPLPITPLTPKFPNVDAATNAPPPNSLRMSEKDIQQTAKFTREFVVMSLLPWMERCVTEWNENFNSTRRLPSRLFSSTKRFFGTPSPSPPPPQSAAGTVGNLPARSNTLPPGSTVPPVAAPPQQRRLAEFATILGDYKLAITVWETLRKDSKGGSDILPLLLAPSPSIPLHASTALSALQSQGTELSPGAQLRALSYVVRWEGGIPKDDFLGSAYDGDRWLVWAAGNSEEPPSAILLALVAHLCLLKREYRKATFWYASAASRLEKSGIKALTKYFLRRACDLATMRPEKSLSPSFWECEGLSPDSFSGFDSILRGLEHPLGRLLYNTGDFAGAVQMLLGLLRPSSFLLAAPEEDANSADGIVPGSDKAFLQDFQVAFGHYKSVAGPNDIISQLKLSISFCQSPQIKIRLPRETSLGDPADWDLREEQWTQFWRSEGRKESLAKSGKANVNEIFFVDVTMRNALSTDVVLTNLTLLPDPSTSPGDALVIETIETLNLAPTESRTISFSVKCSNTCSFYLSHIAYQFLGLLPWKESLSSRGRRLHGTQAERITPTYAPDVRVKIDVVESHDQLVANFLDDDENTFLLGERKHLRLWLSNLGSRPISDAWLVGGPDDVLWIGPETRSSTLVTKLENVPNVISTRKPSYISFSSLGKPSGLLPGESLEVPVLLYMTSLGRHEFHFLIVHRETDSGPLHATRVTRTCEVIPSIEATTTATPSTSSASHHTIKVHVENQSPTRAFHISQISVLSPTWDVNVTDESILGGVQPSQGFRIDFSVCPRETGKDNKTTSFVHSQLQCLLEGKEVEQISPPPINILCHRHNSNASEASMTTPSLWHLIQNSKAHLLRETISNQYSHIPSHLIPFIFPLFHPLAVDLVISWEVPGANRCGHILASGLLVGPGHADVQEIVENAAKAKAKRSMYAETVREKQQLLLAIKNSEWNLEMNPLHVHLRDPGSVIHDFNTPFKPLVVEFVIRNQSLTRHSRYVLRLKPTNKDDPASPNILPSPFIGRTTFRGVLPPCGSAAIQAKIWVSRPGTYTLSGWTLQTEVLQEDHKHVRQEYAVSGSFEDRITICDISR